MFSCLTKRIFLHNYTWLMLYFLYRKNLNTKLYANSLIGVGVASSLYHSSSGKIRKYLRWFDYTMIATATIVSSVFLCFWQLKHAQGYWYVIFEYIWQIWTVFPVLSLQEEKLGVLEMVWLYSNKPAAIVNYLKYILFFLWKRLAQGIVI